MLLFIVYYLISPVLFCLLILISPFNKKVKTVLRQQKKSLQNIKTKLNTNRKKIIIHAASAGEYEQIKPILKTIDQSIYFIIVTCMSPTIYESIKNDKLSDAYCYHPFDFPWSPKSFFGYIKPSIYLTTRHDIWPMHLYSAKKMGIKTIIINANLYKESSRLKWYAINFTRYIFNLFDIIIVPSKRIQYVFNEKLKINNTYLVSDTRFDQVIHRKEKSKKIPGLKCIDGLNNIIFGSIGSDDLDLFSNFQSSSKGYFFSNQNFFFNYIIIVPHEIDLGLIKKIQNFFPESIRFSELKNQNNFNKKSFGILIVDKVGILPELYKYTKIAYVGGGFGKGVHSTIEPLVYNNIVCYGPNIGLLDEAKDMHQRGCGFILNHSSDLKYIIEKYFKNNINYEIKDKIQRYIYDKESSSKKICQIIKKYV